MSARGEDTHTFVPRTIRALAVPLILIWVAYTAAVNLLVPQVEKVGMANAVSMSPQDAPAVIAAKVVYGAQPMVPFAADAAAQSAPKVSFGAPSAGTK